jgi:anti-anti-sigma factor
MSLRRVELSHCLSAEIEDAPGLRCVVLSGEFDISGASPVRDLIAGLAGFAVVVDLSRLEFMSAAGIGVLLEARELVAGAGNHLVLAGATPPVRRLFSLLGLANLLE